MQAEHLDETKWQTIVIMFLFRWHTIDCAFIGKMHFYCRIALTRKRKWTDFANFVETEFRGTRLERMEYFRINSFNSIQVNGTFHAFTQLWLQNKRTFNATRNKQQLFAFISNTNNSRIGGPIGMKLAPLAAVAVFSILFNATRRTIFLWNGRMSQGANYYFCIYFQFKYTLAWAQLRSNYNIHCCPCKSSRTRSDLVNRNRNSMQRTKQNKWKFGAIF